MRALITGGSKGIGRAVVLRLARSGTRNPHQLQQRRDRSRGDGRRGGRGRRPRTLDPGGRLHRRGNLHARTEARATLGELDLLVHCAVTAYEGSALAAPEAAFRDSVEKNGLSFLWLVRAFKDLLAPGSSAIFLSSGGATRAVPNYAPLGVAKALAEGVVRYLAVEMAPQGVRVNAVSAAAVDTAALRAMMPGGVAEQFLATSARRNPSGRALETADVAGAIMALASEDAAMIQGQIVRVDGGLGLL